MRKLGKEQKSQALKTWKEVCQIIEISFGLKPSEAPTEFYRSTLEDLIENQPRFLRLGK